MPISRYTINKFIAGCANFLTTALSPLLMPTYGIFLALWMSVLCLQSYGTRVSILLVCMGITCILPIIFLNVLRHFKLVKDIHVEADVNNINLFEKSKNLADYGWKTEAINIAHCENCNAGLLHQLFFAFVQIAGT